MMCQFLETMASPTCCSLLGLKAVTGWPQRGKSWHFAFPVWKQSLFFAQQSVVLLLTVVLQEILQGYIWMFLSLSWQQGILSQNVLCNACY